MAKSLILKELISALNLSISAFEREIGISASTISKSIERDAEISPLISSKISKKYPNVSNQWLETGTGDMFTQMAVKEEGAFLKTLLKPDIAENDLAETMGITGGTLTAELQNEKLSDDFLQRFSGAFGVDLRRIFSFGLEETKRDWPKHHLPKILKAILSKKQIKIPRGGNMNETNEPEALYNIENIKLGMKLAGMNIPVESLEPNIQLMINRLFALSESGAQNMASALASMEKLAEANRVLAASLNEMISQQQEDWKKQRSKTAVG